MAPQSAEDVKVLNNLIASTLALVKQFRPSISTASTTPAIDNPPNPLRVLRDSASLLKAHTTKVSLLAINKPFTPSAITKVLRDLTSTCLPAMMSAVQICTQEKASYSTLVEKEVQARVSRVFREMENLLNELQSIANGGSAPARRDSLSSTGVVWESCDALIELEKMGLAGLAVKKAEQYRDAVKDAIEELQEWKEGEDLDNEGVDELLDGDDEGIDGDADLMEDIFNAANSLPKDRPELKELVEQAEGKLKKIVLLFNALIRRRLKPFEDGEKGKVKALDAVVEMLRSVQKDVDDLANCFYELNEEDVKVALETCVGHAKEACKIAKLKDGKEDEFTTWSQKWEEAIG
ncbi:hypothetical protein CLAFUW4_11668 [Fulvia fulva]|nr:hypothetical protein CLAFUR4_11673 [Fulvia fulva]WPV17706.1 hypothetical protein CLAFUW4_11668 [Fulvia fulva]